jgi:hypothetical protein
VQTFYKGANWGPPPGVDDYMSSAPTADEQEHKRLSNALEHLKRSNRELAEALEDGPDPIYVEAIQENTEVSNTWICAVRAGGSLAVCACRKELANAATDRVGKKHRNFP